MTTTVQKQTGPALPKAWRWMCGERGVNRVRAFVHAKTGIIFLEYYEPTRHGQRPKVRRISTGTRDEEKGKAAAERLAAELRQGAAPVTERPTLAALFDMYLREVTPEKGTNKQKHDRMCADMFLRAFGRDREVHTLSRREWDRFIRERRSGQLRPASIKKVRAVRDRVIAYDLRFLLAVLNWATLAGTGRGGFLLDRNPLKGLPLPREESPRRPVLSAEAYAKLLEVADRVSPLFRLALVLAHETGHRIGAIRMLRWSDVHLGTDPSIRWRAENDKIGMEHATPLTPAAVAELERARAERPAIGDAWLFGVAGRAGEVQPVDRHAPRVWWVQAWKLAELGPRPTRMMWHSNRRAFATDLKTVPLKDLAALGGWKDTNTILQCYQQPDGDTMRRALAQRAVLAANG